MTTIRLTLPEVAFAIQAWFDRSPAGCCLHNVLEEGGHDQGSVVRALEHAVAREHYECAAVRFFGTVNGSTDPTGPGAPPVLVLSWGKVVRLFRCRVRTINPLMRMTAYATAIHLGRGGVERMFWSPTRCALRGDRWGFYQPRSVLSSTRLVLRKTQ